MLLGLFGVSGVGKTYYSNLIAEKLRLRRLQILTTRAPRKDSANDNKVQVSLEQLADLRRNGEIAFEFEMLGNCYAYRKKDIKMGNVVFEGHYATLRDFRKVYPRLKAIYLFPDSLENAKKRVMQRGLSPEAVAKRIMELEQHFQTISTDEELRSQFDFKVRNYYDHDSEERVLNLAKRLMEGEG